MSDSLYRNFKKENGVIKITTCLNFFSELPFARKEQFFTRFAHELKSMVGLILFLNFIHLVPELHSERILRRNARICNEILSLSWYIIWKIIKFIHKIN